MQKCRNCGKDVNDRFKFCPYCKNKMLNEPEKKEKDFPPPFPVDLQESVNFVEQPCLDPNYARIKANTDADLSPDTAKRTNKKKIIIGVAVAAAVLIIALVCVLVFVVSPKENSKDKDKDNKPSHSQESSSEPETEEHSDKSNDDKSSETSTFDVSDDIDGENGIGEFELPFPANIYQWTTTEVNSELNARF